jgi:hypothetical protein
VVKSRTLRWVGNIVCREMRNATKYVVGKLEKRSLARPSHRWKDTVTGIRCKGVNWVQVAKYKV